MALLQQRAREKETKAKAAKDDKTKRKVTAGLFGRAAKRINFRLQKRAIRQ